MTMKTWNLTDTGVVFHSFKADGTAICRKNIKAGSWAFRTRERAEASVSNIIVNGHRMCESCVKKETATEERAAASMQPATEAHDFGYVAPQEDVQEAPAPETQKSHVRQGDMVWNRTHTGLTYHSFEVGGTVACSPHELKPSRMWLTEREVDRRVSQGAGYKKCSRCVKALAIAPIPQKRHQELRSLLSLSPAPALQEPAQDEDPNTTITESQEDDDMPNARGLTGPLTDIQHNVIRLVSQGLSHQEVADSLSISRTMVGNHMFAITRKMKAVNSAQAIARYAMHLAYADAARSLRLDRVPNPVGEVEEHVNEVLESEAELLALTGSKLLPK